ncbi:phospho-N-acetylmuramoyl-pentapeptide-transferase [Egicoccus sp. AB-alg6-2]|uniref:phospho-N-acetylmuramoyl-pentapeptide- transferase n=1 Tax=Egicoccus sp. AB-alg6-2 TaxID=3242692 RepID=UPI00359CD69F
MIAILISGTIALIAALAGTPLVITYFRERGFGQFIREEGPEAHHAKAGTPTMGGAAIVLAALAGFLVAHLTSASFTRAGWLVMFVFVGMAVVGFADDFIKLRMRRNLGLSKTAKFLGQAIIAAVFAFAGPAFTNLPQNVSVVGGIELQLPGWAFFLWIFLLLAGASNAVNLTDGLDGLAAGSGALVFGAYTLIAFWQFRNPFAYPMLPGEALDVAIIVAAVMAACAGFLWHNAPPASIFMGDTGSLALGGLLAAVAVFTNTQVLLVLLGGLYVLETLSVIIQVAVFRTAGKRVFRMAPIHHHFELLGWQETTIIVRFWIIAGIGVALGLGSFYAEYLSRFGPLG